MNPLPSNKTDQGDINKNFLGFKFKNELQMDCENNIFDEEIMKEVNHKNQIIEEVVHPQARSIFSRSNSEKDTNREIEVQANKNLIPKRPISSSTNTRKKQWVIY